MKEPSMADLNLNRRCVLVVDDDTEFRAVIEEILSDHSLVFAKNAFEAIRHVNTSTFHAYVLDYWLPDWSGAALCREIRKSDPHAPIVFCMAAARDQDRSRAIRAGASAYLCKPIDPQMLRAKLGAFISLSELESLRAKVDEERAVQDELERRFSQVIAQTEHAKTLAASSIERTARAKAYKAFMEARGTRAHFESWWPQVFQSARANHNVR
jgi:DNA-binding response OmpR family regulator